jgi:ATP-binding cassette subfamily B protein
MQPVKKWASESAVVHDNIMGFNKQYETILGERGITLSEVKTTSSIARAIIKTSYFTF